MGSLVASVVATRTLAHLHPWQDQFVISGLVCMVVVAIAFVALRELSPQLRDQLMVSENERALVDARAKGIDVEKATRHPMRSMLRLDLIASSLGISVFLLIYYASVSVLTLYWVVIFNRTTADANGINMWYWACMSLMLVAFGVVSDRFRVRKPFMLIGAAGTIVMTIVLLHQIDHPTTGYYSNVFVVVLLGLFIGYDLHAVDGGLYRSRRGAQPRAVGHRAGGVGLDPADRGRPVVPRPSPGHHHLDHPGGQPGRGDEPADLPAGPALSSPPPGTSTRRPRRQASSRRSRTCSPTVPGRPWRHCSRRYGTTHDVMAAMAAVPASLKLQVQGLLAFSPLATDIQAGRPVSDAQIAAVHASSPQLATLLSVEPKVIPAQKASSNEWKRWWWVCVAGQLVFLVLVFFMRGRWSPRAAKADFDQHERLVAAELAKLRGKESGRRRIRPVRSRPGLGLGSGPARCWHPPVPRTVRCGCARPARARDERRHDSRRSEA